MSTKLDKRKKMNREGPCKLTGEHGKFVASHILPRSLTRLGDLGEKIHEAGLGVRPRKRPATWYDDELVIAKGEKILEDIDTPAIELLRSHKLVWSAFPKSVEFGPNELIPFSDQIFLREVELGHAHELRLFFLSIAWRAGASQRSEFNDARLPEQILEDLRTRVYLRDAGSAWDYPIILDQIIDRGEPHNRTPVVEEFPITIAGSDDTVMVVSVRIYIDGLVARVLVAKDFDIDRGIGRICLGAENTCYVWARRYEGSRTAENLVEIITDAANRGYHPRC